MSTTTKNGQKQSGEFIRKRVSTLKPSPENQMLYKPIDPDDPEIIKLADAIAKHGCDPLTVTSDNYIVSGHRRHVALTINGQVMVSCRVLSERRDSMHPDDYIVLLRTYNQQRHKSVAEQVREEMVDLNAEDAFANLRELRDKSIRAVECNGVARVLDIEGSKTRHRISDEKADHVKYVNQVVFTERRNYWPLSVRGVHYALLNFDFIRGYYWPHRDEPDFGIKRILHYRNDDGSYDATSDLITRMRLNGSIPWEAFDDGTRPLQEFHPFNNVRAFVRHEVKNLFNGYWRNLLQTQPNHVEVVCEKNTIYHMVLRVTRAYQIPTSSGRGFNSIDPWHDLFERYKASGKERLIVIVLSDFDPEGEMIPQVCGRTLQEFGVKAEIIKAGVTREQIRKYNLPTMNFAKEHSSNRDWFIERNGGDGEVYELEALQPQNMLGDLDDIVQSVLDMDLFNREAQREQEEAVYLKAARKTAGKTLKGLCD